MLNRFRLCQSRPKTCQLVKVTFWPFIGATRNLVLNFEWPWFNIFNTSVAVHTLYQSLLLQTTFILVVPHNFNSRIEIYHCTEFDVVSQMHSRFIKTAHRYAKAMDESIISIYMPLTLPESLGFSA